MQKKISHELKLQKIRAKRFDGIFHQFSLKTGNNISVGNFLLVICKTDKPWISEVSIHQFLLL